MPKVGVCKKCGNTDYIYAKGLCIYCYQKAYQRKNQAKFRSYGKAESSFIKKFGGRK